MSPSLLSHVGSQPLAGNGARAGVGALAVAAAAGTDGTPASDGTSAIVGGRTALLSDESGDAGRGASSPTLPRWAATSGTGRKYQATAIANPMIATPNAGRAKRIELPQREHA